MLLRDIIVDSEPEDIHNKYLMNSHMPPGYYPAIGNIRKDPDHPIYLNSLADYTVSNLHL